MNQQRLAGYFVEPAKRRSQANRLEELIARSDRIHTQTYRSVALVATLLLLAACKFGTGPIKVDELLSRQTGLSPQASHTWLSNTAIAGLVYSVLLRYSVVRNQEEIEAILESIPQQEAKDVLTKPGRHKRWQRLKR